MRRDDVSWKVKSWSHSSRNRMQKCNKSFFDHIREDIKVSKYEVVIFNANSRNAIKNVSTIWAETWVHEMSKSLSHKSQSGIRRWKKIVWLYTKGS